MKRHVCTHGWLLGFFLILLFPTVAKADTAGNSLFYWEMNLFHGYSRKNGSFGAGNNSRKSFGIEHYKRFSGDYGDWLVTDIQIRLAYNSDVNLFGHPFDIGGKEEDSLDLEIHNAYARFKLLYGRADIWIGHYEPAFGQEPQIDTYPIILQSLAMKNIGFKKDWGAGIKGAFPKWDYQITATTGSGMGIHSKGNYLFAGRIGIGDPSFDNYNLGFSAMYGKTLEVMGRKLLSDQPLLKKRVGMDASFIYGSFDLKGEISFGTDNGKDVMGAWAQVYYLLPSNQKWRLETQYQNWFYDLGKGGDVDSTVIIGFSYKLNAAYHFRAYYAHDKNGRTGKGDDKGMFQLYYYYPELRGITNLLPE